MTSLELAVAIGDIRRQLQALTLRVAALEKRERNDQTTQPLRAPGLLGDCER